MKTKKIPSPEEAVFFVFYKSFMNWEAMKYSAPITMITRTSAMIANRISVPIHRHLRGLEQFARIQRSRFNSARWSQYHPQRVHRAQIPTHAPKSFQFLLSIQPTMTKNEETIAVAHNDIVFIGNIIIC